MPKGGRRANAGRKPGSKNKLTVERELLAQAAAEQEQLKTPDEIAADAAELARAQEIAAEAERQLNLKAGLAKQYMLDAMKACAGLMSYYQLTPDPKMKQNPNASASEFERWLQHMWSFAKELASYQSPRLAAVMVGQAQTQRIEVVGGLPSPNGPPTLTDVQYEEAMKVVEDAGPVDSGVTSPAPALSPAAK